MTDEPPERPHRTARDPEHEIDASERAELTRDTHGKLDADEHGEIARMSEDEVDIDEPHVGDARGPVLEEPQNPELADERRALDPIVGQRNPPIRPKSDQVQ